MTNPTPPRDDAPELRVAMVTANLTADDEDLPSGPCVILRGDIEAVQAAAKMFGQVVQIIRHAVQPARVGVDRERVAVALWQNELGDSAPRVRKARTLDHFREQLDEIQAKFLRNADAAIAALLPTEAGAEPVSAVGSCATENCDNPAAWLFESGNVTSKYCNACYRKVATPPAAPTDNTALVEHVKKMQSYVQEYLEPGPYVAKHGKGGTFDEPHPHQDEAHAYFMRQRMREAVLNDLIHMLDGPEERAALSREAPQAVTVWEALEQLACDQNWDGYEWVGPGFTGKCIAKDALRVLGGRT